MATEKIFLKPCSVCSPYKGKRRWFSTCSWARNGINMFIKAPNRLNEKKTKKQSCPSMSIKGYIMCDWLNKFPRNSYTHVGLPKKCLYSISPFFFLSAFRRISSIWNGEFSLKNVVCLVWFVYDHLWGKLGDLFIIVFQIFSITIILHLKVLSCNILHIIMKYQDCCLLRKVVMNTYEEMGQR